MVQYCVLKFSH